MKIDAPQSDNAHTAPRSVAERLEAAGIESCELFDPPYVEFAFNHFGDPGKNLLEFLHRADVFNFLLSCAATDIRVPRARIRRVAGFSKSSDTDWKTRTKKIRRSTIAQVSTAIRRLRDNHWLGMTRNQRTQYL